MKGDVSHATLAVNLPEGNSSRLDDDEVSVLWECDMSETYIISHGMLKKIQNFQSFHKNKLPLNVFFASCWKSTVTVHSWTNGIFILSKEILLTLY